MNSFYTILSNVSPYLRVAMDSRLPSNWIMHERIILDYEIMYIKDGKGQVTIEDRIYDAAPGDVFIFRPGIRHSVRTSLDKGIRQPHVHFDLIQDRNSEILEVNFTSKERVPLNTLKMMRIDINAQSDIKLPEKVVLYERSTFEGVLFSLIDEFHNSTKISFLKYKSGIVDLLAILLNTSYNLDNKNNNIIINYNHMDLSREFIRANYLEKLTLKALCKTTNMSKNNLLRRFKRQFGMTPICYQIFLRIENAKILLLGSNSNITEIALYLGFSNVQYFSKVFKKHTGKSPTLYKKIAADIPMHN